MKKKITITCIIILILIIVSEIYLRLYWGFCDTVLMQKSDKYEYIAQPNQNRFRFRKHINYNEFSMRSDSLSNNDKIRILGFGDSVINGGAITDHDSLATTIIEKELANKYGYSIRCLNISAGSWGPDNCYAYLEEHGDFDADLIFLVLCSHDAYDNITFEEVVDVQPSFPSKQYLSAIYELIDRYIIPRYIKSSSKAQNDDPIAKGDIFNSGFLSFYNYTKQNEIPFFIYLHPTLSEVRNNCYDHQGDSIISFCAEKEISLIQGLFFEEEVDFRDKIHFNDKGQKKMADILLPEIKKNIDIILNKKTIDYE